MLNICMRKSRKVRFLKCWILVLFFLHGFYVGERRRCYVYDKIDSPVFTLETRDNN